MGTSLAQLEAIPQCCPLCDGELYVAQSSPKGGAACPFCRRPLWFLRKTVKDIVVLTLLAEERRKVGAFGWNDHTFWPLQNTSALVVDLSRLSAVSSMLLEALVTRQRELQSTSGTMKVCGLCTEVANAFRAAKLETRFDIYPDEQTALDSFHPTDSSAPAPTRSGAF
jgi:uncharacterized protein YbaR (Trm112 family)